MQHNQMINMLKKIEQTKIDKINQEVCISELFVRYHKNSSFGESDTVHQDTRNRVTRLAQHIKIWADIAQQYHKDHYFEDGSVKPKALNKITRLSVNECALYTNETPLSEAEYEVLVKHIEQIAKDLPVNVHLALGTVAVALDNRTPKLQLNISLYVQGGGGEQAKMFPTAKAHPNVADREYENYKLYGKFLNNTLTKLKNFDERVDSTNVSANYNPVFIVETEGGAKVTVGVDKCLDYDVEHTKNEYEKEVKSVLTNEDDMTYFPYQRSHVLLANSTEIQEGKSITHTITNADPDSKGGSLTNQLMEEQKQHMLDPSEQDHYSHIPSTQEMKDAGFTYTDILVTPEEISVKNPPFGSDYAVVAYLEHSLIADQLLEHYKPMVDQANQSTMKRRIEATLKSNNVSLVEESRETNYVEKKEAPKEKNHLDDLKSHWENIKKDKSIRINSVMAPRVDDFIKTICDDSKSNKEKYMAVKELKNVIEHFFQKSSTAAFEAFKPMLDSVKEIKENLKSQQQTSTMKI